jgi:ferredoxin
MSADRAEHASQITVSFRLSGKCAVWDESMDSLLEFAEFLGVSAPFSCRVGICGTCKSELIRGSVTYVETALAEPEEGWVLLCCSRPAESVEINI